MDKSNGLSYGTFHKDNLIKIENASPKRSLSDFRIGLTVILRSGGPDMWVLTVNDNGKIECGWIINNKSHSKIFSYQCLSIKEE